MEHLIDARIFKYIGLPYRDKNCWDIVMDFYLEFFELELHQYYEVGHTDIKEVNGLIHCHEKEFIKVDLPSFGTIVIMSKFGVPSHVGVYVGDGYVLHSSEKTDCVLEHIDRMPLRIEGLYECKV